ncbi:four-helix bundle copper-binding protein [Paenibacillus sp. FSL K6-2859]|uniref:four-helix bundle copper-binding protein n=1 Tax=Paenibacillus sp. FSL K6-2859 TaxID=2921482 RepID=UPI0030FB4599
MKECIRLDCECAKLCTYTASALSINSSYARELCTLCAAVCESCGNECKKYESHHCQQCAEACFRCAEACRAMAS